ncbi:unnamed protein product [marine sediment metagenome]|uniref:Uncharacterized protein n=1 Tax=marine sediment metagenome TaxID=412755 RepID=X0S502_9ZZZZ
MKMRQKVSKEEISKLTVTNDTILNYATSIHSTVLGLGFSGFFSNEEEKEPKPKDEEKDE